MSGARRAPDKDLSRQVQVLQSRSCRNFPPESSIENINYAVVSVLVTVGKDGKPISATALSEPGFGFGREGVRCALTTIRYEPALDPWGRPIVSTRKLNITFRR